MSVHRAVKALWNALVHCSVENMGWWMKAAKNRLGRGTGLGEGLRVSAHPCGVMNAWTLRRVRSYCPASRGCSGVLVSVASVL